MVFNGKVWSNFFVFFWGGGRGRERIRDERREIGDGE